MSAARYWTFCLCMLNACTGSIIMLNTRYLLLRTLLSACECLAITVENFNGGQWRRGHVYTILFICTIFLKISSSLSFLQYSEGGGGFGRLSSIVLSILCNSLCFIESPFSSAWNSLSTACPCIFCPYYFLDLSVFILHLCYWLQYSLHLCLKFRKLLGITLYLISINSKCDYL